MISKSNLTLVFGLGMATMSTWPAFRGETESVTFCPGRRETGSRGTSRPESPLLKLKLTCIASMLSGSELEIIIT